MPDLIIAASATPTLVVRGDNRRFPVHRIYCVGRNFAEHAREMGSEIDRGSPVFFMKPADAVLPGGGDQPFPSATSDLHHEVELVV
ncbi:MAG: fumarylacetoacetate hydrolase, partial [Gammaproteobacteria bacterium HGW-Gammaproteobacteria-5]